MDLDIPATRKNIEHAFSTPNHNGQLYNTENDRPVHDVTVVGQVNTTRVEDHKRLQNTKLGDTVKYYGNKQGKVVSRSSHIIKIIDDESKQVVSVPISQTIFPSEVFDGIECQFKVIFEISKINWAPRLTPAAAPHCHICL